MKEIIDWLIDIESLATEVYAEAASSLQRDSDFAEFSRHLSLEEDEHHGLMIKARELFEERKISRPALLSLSGEERARIEDYFLSSRKKIAAGNFGKDEFVDLITAMEFSEWNDMFLYVISIMRHSAREFMPAISKINQHKMEILRFIKSRPEYDRYAEKIAGLPKVLEEKILVVDDDEMLLDVLVATLGSEGVIDRASTGADGLRLLSERYYAVIVTDYDMPVMGGREFFERAAERYPSTKERFLFFTGVIDEERRAFFKTNNIRHLLKPSQVKEIRSTVAEIMYR